MTGNPIAQRKRGVEVLLAAAISHAWQDNLIEKDTERRPSRGGVRIDYYTALVDLQADLLHLADNLGVEPSEIIDRGLEHYEHEISAHCPHGCGACYSPEAMPEICENCENPTVLMCAECRQEIDNPAEVVTAKDGTPFHKGCWKRAAVKKAKRTK